MSSLYIKKGTNLVYIGYTDPAGRRRDRSTKIRVKSFTADGSPVIPREAIAIQKDLDAKLRLGFQDFPERRSRVLLSHAWKNYLEQDASSNKVSTRALGEIAYNKFLTLVGNRPVSSLSEEEMFSVRAGLLKINSHNTVARDLRHISAFFSFCVKRGYTRSNPVTKDVKLQEIKRPVVVYSDEELRTLFGYLKVNRLPLHDQLMFLLLTGFRSAESCNLQWTQVDFAGGILHHQNEKGNRSSIFPLYPALKVLLEGLPRNGSAFVFAYRKNSYLLRALRRAQEHCMKGTTKGVHILKKTFLSKLIGSGVSAPQLHVLANHRSIQTTMDYYNAFSSQDMIGILSQSTAKLLQEPKTPRKRQKQKAP